MQLFYAQALFHGSLLKKSNLLLMSPGCVAFYKRFLFELPSLSLKPPYRVQRWIKAVYAAICKKRVETYTRFIVAQLAVVLNRNNLCSCAYYSGMNCRIIDLIVAQISRSLHCVLPCLTAWPFPPLPTPSLLPSPVSEIVGLTGLSAHGCNEKQPRLNGV